MRWVAGLILLTALSTADAQPLVVNENSQAFVDLTFERTDGTPALPLTLTYRLDDRDSRMNLIPETPMNPPGVFLCPGVQDGCMSLMLPASANIIVGICRGTTNRPCRTSADCPNMAVCAASNEGFQSHVLTLKWTYPGGSAQDRAAIRTLNLEF